MADRGFVGVANAATLAAFVLCVAFGSRMSAQDVTTSDPTMVVTVEGDTSASWRVVEQLRPLLPRDISSRDRGGWQYLARACSTVDSIGVAVGGTVVAPLVEEMGPWRTLRDTSGIDWPPLVGDVTVRYLVKRTGDQFDVPLIHPTRAIPNANARVGSVAVVVRLPDAQGTVTFPRMERSRDGREWRGRFVAVPAFVRVRLTSSAAPCASSVPEESDGGLSWRFWLLVAILVVWVPTYQWWARRQTEDDE